MTHMLTVLRPSCATLIRRLLVLLCCSGSILTTNHALANASILTKSKSDAPLSEPSVIQGSFAGDADSESVPVFDLYLRAEAAVTIEPAKSNEEVKNVWVSTLKLILSSSTLPTYEELRSTVGARPGRRDVDRDGREFATFSFGPIPEFKVLYSRLSGPLRTRDGMQDPQLDVMFSFNGEHANCLSSVEVEKILRTHSPTAAISFHKVSALPPINPQHSFRFNDTLVNYFVTPVPSECVAAIEMKKTINPIYEDSKGEER